MFITHSAVMLARAACHEPEDKTLFVRVFIVKVFDFFILQSETRRTGRVVFQQERIVLLFVRISYKFKSFIILSGIPGAQR